MKCGNAGDNVVLTFKGGCRKDLNIADAYRCVGCGGRFHKDCIIEHFKLEKEHDWGRKEGFNEGIEAAAKEIETFGWHTDDETGLDNYSGHDIAKAIRALKK